MVTIKLGFDNKEKYGWRVLQKGECADRHFLGEMYNEKFVILINAMLWEKVKNIMKIRERGFDSIILIDGRRRTGKSTLAKIIAYLLNPNITINNYVVGLEDSPAQIEKAEVGSPLIFDEGSLIASSRDTMRTKNVQLSKIIDVVGQKRLCLIFCMPSFFEIARPIATTHSLFLIHIYTYDKLKRGFFAYFGTKKKRLLYEIGKKNYNSYKKPTANFTGDFDDFELPFEKEYIKLKMDSLKEALNPSLSKQKDKLPTELDSEMAFIMKLKANNPNLTDEQLYKSAGIGKTAFYRRKKLYEGVFAKE